MKNVQSISFFKIKKNKTSNNCNRIEIQRAKQVQENEEVFIAKK